MTPTARVVPRRRAGEAMVEFALLLIAFLAILLGIMDWAWTMYAHETIVSRVSRAARWAAVRPYPGTNAEVEQIIKFGEPCGGCSGAPFGLDSATITVDRPLQPYTTAGGETVNLKRMIVTVSNYRVQHWLLGGSFDARPITATALWECVDPACTP